MKRILFFPFLILLIAKIAVVSSGCANIVPPQGGLKDSLAPELTKANPGNSTRNFTGNRITFSFDEFIELQNVQENLLVSPLPKLNPSVDSKLSTVTIKLKDTLEANTTYSLNFGDAIKDVNEGNVLKNFTYTFSTGRYIDSLELSGKVVNAETGKPDSTLIVMLHTSSYDSAVIKERPRYIARLDGKGNFIFKNLPSKTFYLYALKDDGGTRRYFDNKQLFAFADKPIVVQQENKPVQLYAYATKQAVVVPAAPAANAGNRNKPGSNLVEKRLRYQTNLINNQQDLLSDFIMTFEQPLRLFDSSKMRLYTDSTFTPVAGYRFQKDTSNRKLQLAYSWKENTLYRIIMDKNFAEDTSGKKLLKTDTLSFKTKKLSEYGSLKLKLRNLDLSKNPVLLFRLNAEIVQAFPLGSADFSKTLFLPGEYELSILYDDNKNGVWDPGEFFDKHKQPEIVRPITRKIPVKAAWQNEFEIDTSL